MGRFFAWFRGRGWLFVISGFLIPSIIFRQLEQGRFCLRHFYSRRTGVEIVDPTSILSTDGRIPPTMPDGTPIYKDKSHLRPFYIREYMGILGVMVQ